ncbi:hypothetical protein SAMN04487969_10657 [Paenibacillus algorifonticola]|uniref:Group-specific protein n=1 Tax=Paenibacillus algorifonticola TaxID=684063 RepID=A0A1I2D3F6_9BACL|nr:hypothetical protein [Paenibacillus algorifonticola]SFE74593.1 hypothetical protein SAMN04487969_10657 [Paenibacillus algorifonticola]
MIVPLYAENIVVGIVFQNQFNWYISTKEYWILDYKKYGINNENLFDNEREGIIVLDETTVSEFLNKIIEYKVEIDELKEKFLFSVEIDEDNAIYDYRPSLLINFDEKFLYSTFPEYTSFEEYIPDKWIGEYKNFYGLIDESFKYWCNDNENYFEGDIS